MKYLEATKLKEDKRVLTSVVRWFNTHVKVGDCVTDTSDRVSPYVLKDARYVRDYLAGYMGVSLPLLNEEQLWQYLTDVTGRYVCTYFTGDDFVTVAISLKDPMDIREGANLEHCSIVDEIIDVYWAVMVDAHNLGIILKEYTGEV